MKTNFEHSSLQVILPKEKVSLLRRIRLCLYSPKMFSKIFQDKQFLFYLKKTEVMFSKSWRISRDRFLYKHLQTFFRLNAGLLQYLILPNRFCAYCVIMGYPRIFNANLRLILVLCYHRNRWLHCIQILYDNLFHATN